MAIHLEPNYSKSLGTDEILKEQTMKAKSPEGREIIGTLDVIQGTARAEVNIETDGTLRLEYCGETQVDWDSQRTKTEDGERLFVCSAHKVWRESQIVSASVSRV